VTAKRVEDPAAELTRLREENARLRALLGLDERPADGHAVAWSPTLLPTSEAGPPVDADSSNEVKLALFRSLFGARSDVYAVRWENPSTGRSGWSPATQGTNKEEITIRHKKKKRKKKKIKNVKK